MIGDFHMQQQLQLAQNKTAKNHSNKVQNLIGVVFNESFDLMLKVIKSELFGVEDGGPIIPRDHPRLVELWALSRPLCNGMHPITRRPSSLRVRAHHQAPVIPARARTNRRPSSLLPYLFFQ